MQQHPDADRVWSWTFAARHPKVPLGTTQAEKDGLKLILYKLKAVKPKILSPLLQLRWKYQHDGFSGVPLIKGLKSFPKTISVDIYILHEV